MRIVITAAAFLVSFFACGCSRPVPAASVFNVADRRYQRQLLPGLYDVESESSPSRWSMRKFGVALKPPPGAGQSGGRLWLRFFIPDTHVADLGAMTLRAEVDGHSLPPETFSTAGFHDYTREVPPLLLDTNMVPVRFVFDKAMPPSTIDARELGAVITYVGLLAGAQPSRSR